MKILLYHLLLLCVFCLYQFLAAFSGSPPFDPFFPLLLGALFWRLSPFQILLAVGLWGLVADTFSFTVPGASVIGYFLGLLLFDQLRKRLALRGLFPALLTLLLSISFCELIRLFLMPLLLELALPRPAFYFLGRILLGTLVWGFLCWLFCQFSLVRDIFETTSPQG